MSSSSGILITLQAALVYISVVSTMEGMEEQIRSKLLRRRLIPIANLPVFC